jgi:hypothetical protein
MAIGAGGGANLLQRNANGLICKVVEALLASIAMGLPKLPECQNEFEWQNAAEGETYEGALWFAGKIEALHLADL